jgi:hypothetical protein
MPPRSPSEIQRLYEEMNELKSIVTKAWNKAEKEAALQEIRNIESLLGIESKPYNRS